MSIGNGLSFAQAAALAGINPTSLLGMGLGSDSSVTRGVDSLTTSNGYRPPTYTYTPTYTPTPSFGTINQVTGNGFGSSTSNFFTPSNSIFTNTGNSFTNNLPKTTGKTTPTGGKTTTGDTNILDTRTSKSSLPPVDKPALLDVSADAGPGNGKVNLGADPVE